MFSSKSNQEIKTLNFTMLLVVIPSYNSIKILLCLYLMLIKGKYKNFSKVSNLFMKSFSAYKKNLKKFANKIKGWNQSWLKKSESF